MKSELCACVVALIAFAVCAEETETEGESPKEGAEVAKRAPARASFSTLPFCRFVEGDAEVCRPGGDWEAAEEGRFYPLGTSYRTGRKGSLTLAFATDSTVSLSADSEFGTRAQALGVSSRTIVPVRGTVELKLADNLPEGAFFIAAPGFTVKNPAGQSRVSYNDKGDGDEATVRCITGSLAVDGRHFEIPAMHSANEVVIRTSHDHLATFLFGTSGDYVVKLDQGLRTKEEIGDDGQMKRSVEKGVTEWHLSPATRVVINRSVPAIGERMSVHTMAFDAAGERKSECAFCEGRAEVNSGELVAKEKSSGDDLARRAAEATETTAATDVEDAPAEEGEAKKTTSDEE